MGKTGKTTMYVDNGRYRMLVRLGCSLSYDREIRFEFNHVMMRGRWCGEYVLPI